MKWTSRVVIFRSWEFILVASFIVLPVIFLLSPVLLLDWGQPAGKPRMIPP